jgi:hypothetical protein
MQTAEVLAILQSILDWKICEVLVPKDQDFSLRCERRELRFSGITQRAELNTSDLCADCGRDVFGLNSRPEQFGKI